VGVSRLWEAAAVQVALEDLQPYQAGALGVEDRPQGVGAAELRPNFPEEEAGEVATLPLGPAKEGVGVAWAPSPTLLQAGVGASPLVAWVEAVAWGGTEPQEASGVEVACLAVVGACDVGGASPGAWGACLGVPVEAEEAWPWVVAAADPRWPFPPWEGAQGVRRQTTGEACLPAKEDSGPPATAQLPNRGVRLWRPS